MATVNKNFKVKNGLVVEGSTATVAGNNILTETAGDSYILGLVGGAAYITSVNADDFTVTGGELTIAAGSDLARTGDITDALFGYATEIYVTTALGDYTTTAQLDTVISNLGYITSSALTGYATESFVTSQGYLTSADLTGYATQSDVTTAINNLTTDDIEEGTNKYFSTSLVDSHLYGGNGIDYTSGTIAARLGTGLEIDGANQIAINRSTVDSWYEDNGATSTHAGLTSTHGVTGSIVGTSDTQTLSNKTFDGATNIGVDGSVVTDTSGDLEVKAQQILTLKSRNSDIILNADGTVYVGSATAGNEVATHGYVDNAVSGLAWKQAVNLKVDYSINVAADQVGAVFDSHDALTTADAGYRFLLTDQNTASENGIWESYVDGSTLLLRRPTDADVYSELIGAAVYVMEGTQYGSTSWVQGNHYLTDFTGQNWTQFSGQGSVTAGYGISVDGLEVSVDAAVIASQQDLTDGLALKQDELIVGNGLDLTGANLDVNSGEMINKVITGVSGNSYGIVGNATYLDVTNPTGYHSEIDVDIAAIESTLDTDGYAKQTDITTAVSTKADAANPTLTGSLTLDGTGDFTITSDANIVLDANTTSYIGSALAANEIATKGYVDNAIDNVTIDLSGAAGAYIDWNAAVGDGQYDVNIADIITDGDIATNTSVGSDITTAIDALDTDDIEEGATNKYASTTNVVAALFDQPSAVNVGSTEIVAAKFSGGDVSGNQATFNSVKTNAIYSNDLSMQRESTVGTVATASTVEVIQIGAPTGRAVKVMIKLTSGSHAHVWEALLAIDASQNVAVTEYAEVTTDGVLGSLAYPVQSDGKGGYYLGLSLTTLNSNTAYKILTEAF